MTTQSGPLDPREQDIYTLDFTPLLNSGETLASIVSTFVSVVRGSDPNAANFLLSTPAPAINQAAVTVNGATSPVTVAALSCVQGVMGGGLDGVWYEIGAVCLTSNPERRLVCKMIVPVTAS